MIQFGRLLSFPLTFRHLEPKIKELKMDFLDAYLDSDNIINVNSVVNGHQVELKIHSGIIDSSSPVTCHCTCEQFKFNHAYSLYKVGSLLRPEEFFLRPPKSKNTSMTLSGCKHIILVSRTLYQNKNLIRKGN